ncbi:MAG: hypothetical protein ACI8QC_001688 [Planctomycetota bacterium]|jgi:hypothetical protein
MLQIIPCLALAFASPANPATLLPPAVLQEPDARNYNFAKQAAGEALATQMEELAVWCQKNKAYLERNRAYEVVILYKPDHKLARKLLGYNFDRKSKEWTRRGNYKAPKNSKPPEALEALEKRELIFAAYTESLIAAIEANIDTLPKRIRLKDLQPLLEERPDDARVRTLMGQVRLFEDGKPDEWVLPTTKLALERRKSLRDFRRSNRKSAPAPKSTNVQDVEADMGFKWNVKLDNGTVRLLSSGSSSESERVLRDLHMLWRYLPEVMGGKLTVGDGTTIYLLTNPGAKDKFGAESSLLSDTNRNYWAKTVGTFLGASTSMALYNSNQPGRLDMACRLTVSLYLWQEYGISADRGWVTEGFGLYLVNQMQGTRLSYTLNSDEYEDKSEENFASRIKEPDSDWLELARRMLRDKKAPGLQFVLGKDVGAMAPRDLIIANALAAYLVEAHGPKVVESILRRIGGTWVDGELIKPKDSAARVLEQVLEARLPEIYTLLEDWLTEMKRR